MKKIVCLLLAVVMLFCFCACTDTPSEESGTGDVISNNIQSESPTVNNNQSQQTNTASCDSASDAEWKQFLKDYEAWVDDYIEILEKYKKNPTDMTILSDYTDMMSKTAEWSAKADKIQGELAASPAALKEYTETLSRIINKLTKAAY